VPGVFSQGETLEELEENIRDAYRMVMEDDVLPVQVDVQNHASAVPKSNILAPSISKVFRNKWVI